MADIGNISGPAPERQQNNTNEKQQDPDQQKAETASTNPKEDLKQSFQAVVQELKERFGENTKVIREKEPSNITEQFKKAFEPVMEKLEQPTKDKSTKKVTTDLRSSLAPVIQELQKRFGETKAKPIEPELKEAFAPVIKNFEKVIVQKPQPKLTENITKHLQETHAPVIQELKEKLKPIKNDLHISFEKKVVEPKAEFEESFKPVIKELTSIFEKETQRIEQAHTQKALERGEKIDLKPIAEAKQNNDQTRFEFRTLNKAPYIIDKEEKILILEPETAEPLAETIDPDPKTLSSALHLLEECEWEEEHEPTQEQTQHYHPLPTNTPKTEEPPETHTPPPKTKTQYTKLPTPTKPLDLSPTNTQDQETEKTQEKQRRAHRAYIDKIQIEKQGDVAQPGTHLGRKDYEVAFIRNLNLKLQGETP